MITEKIYSDWMEDTQMNKIRKILHEVDPVGLVLDVGSGPGFLERFIDAVAIDVNVEDLKKFSGPRIAASGDALPFEDESFDTVFCIDTVHKLKNTSELERVLSKDGLLVVSTFCNKHNFKEKALELKNKFPDLEIEKQFMIETKKEWDFVLVLKKSNL